MVLGRTQDTTGDSYANLADSAQARFEASSPTSHP